MSAAAAIDTAPGEKTAAKSRRQSSRLHIARLLSDPRAKKRATEQLARWKADVVARGVPHEYTKVLFPSRLSMDAGFQRRETSNELEEQMDRECREEPDLTVTVYPRGKGEVHDGSTVAHEVTRQNEPMESLDSWDREQHRASHRIA